MFRLVQIIYQCKNSQFKNSNFFTKAYTAAYLIYEYLTNKHEKSILQHEESHFGFKAIMK